MRKKELSRIVGDDESDAIEWKPSLSQVNEIVESVSAFSNARGGRIIVGVSKSGKILGVKIGKDTIERLTNKIHQNADPKVHPDIIVKRIENKTVIIVKVKESLDKLVLAFGRPFKRVGKSTVKMSKEEYERLILEKHRERLQFDKQICKEARLEDIDKKKVNRYLSTREKIRKIKKPKDMPYEELLMNIGAAQKVNNRIIPTNAGILFFGKYPKRFFIQSQLRVVKFKGKKVIHPVIDRLDSANTLWEMIKEAEEFIRKSIRLLSFRTEKSFMREDKFEYPIKALREAIINALIHRDYRETADTRVFIFDDRIEMINPGTFPKDVTPAKPIHKAVNPVLCSLMYDVGFIEKYGSGIYMMRELCKKWEMKKPRYKLHPIETKLIFESKIKEPTLVKIEKKILKNLNERQKKAINYIREHKAITRKEYEKLCKISDRTANRELGELVKKGILQKKGSGVKFYYELAN